MKGRIDRTANLVTLLEAINQSGATGLCWHEMVEMLNEPEGTAREYDRHKRAIHKMMNEISSTPTYELYGAGVRGDPTRIRRSD